MAIEELRRQSGIKEDRILKLKEIFPEIFVDGEVNLSLFKQELFETNSDIYTDNLEEFYGLQWVGKKEARQLAYLPPQGTLKLKEGEGINSDSTRNVFIEGDNLEVLRVLHKSYREKVKCIYIDPPYNTGSDFVYKDDFKDSVEKYLQKSKQADEEGLLTSNPKTGGRFHANWLSMMYPRLKLARDFLREDGVIFISIDDNEQANLKLLMDEIFGEENFLASAIWQKIHSIKNDAKYFSNNHEYVLIYAKKIDNVSINLLERTEEMDARYKNPDNDPRGPWQSGDLVANEHRKGGNYEIVGPTGKVFTVPYDKHWVYSQENLLEMIKDNRVYFGKDGNAFPRKKRFLSEVLQGRKAETLWLSKEVGHNQEAKRELKKLFEGMILPFDTPKPVRLIKRVLQLVTSHDQEDLVLDFFGGSGTTAQAVMELNHEDNGNRRFLLVQIPEVIDHRSYSNIAQVASDRIEKSIECLNKEGKNQVVDNGFKVFKLDTSNLRKWQLVEDENSTDLEQRLSLFDESPFLDDYKEIDVVVELMINQGFPLDSEISKLKESSLWIISHVDVPFNLLVCLEELICDDTVRYLLENQSEDTLICFDNALTDEVKVLLSETMKVKTI